MDSMLKLSTKSQAVLISETSKRDTKTLVSNLSASMHSSLGNHVEREIKNLAPYLAKLTADTVQQHLTKEVNLSSYWLLRAGALVKLISFQA